MRCSSPFEAVSTLYTNTAMHPLLSKARRIQVVYYLSRGGQLEHPHLLELTISSTEGLRLRDVKERLMAIRGKGVAASFSWSYKRSYKNGYVWQDISDDDLIFPAHGCEYVLKGSEIFPTPEKLKATTEETTPEGKDQLGSQNIPLKRRLLEKATEITENENSEDNAVSRSHSLQDVLKLNQSPREVMVDDGLLNKAEDDPYQKFVDRQEFEDCKSKVTALSAKCGMEAATQTEEGKVEAFRNGLKAGDESLHSEVAKGGVSPPPSSSSSTGSTGSPIHNEKGRKPFHLTEKYGKPFKRSSNTSSDSAASSNRNTVRKSWKPQVFMKHDADTPTSSKFRHLSGPTSLLQFMSCGGLDIKDEMLPMSEQLKPKDSQHTTSEQVCELLRSVNCRPWYRLGRRGISKFKNSAGGCADLVDNKAVSDVSSAMDQAQDIDSKAPYAIAILPDVISLGRSSGSDQSCYFSSELDQNEPQILKVHTNPLSVSVVEKSSEILEFPIDADQLTRGKLSAISNIPAKNQKIFNNELINSDLVDNHSRKERDDGGKACQSITLSWEEVVAPKRDYKNHEEMLLPPQRSKADWEKALQIAADQALPPPDFDQYLQECVHCSRKFRPDSLKVHIRSCGKQKSCKASGINKNAYPLSHPSSCSSNYGNTAAFDVCGDELNT